MAARVGTHPFLIGVQAIEAASVSPDRHQMCRSGSLRVNRYDIASMKRLTPSAQETTLSGSTRSMASSVEWVMVWVAMFSSNQFDVTAMAGHPDCTNML